MQQNDRSLADGDVVPEIDADPLRVVAGRLALGPNGWLGHLHGAHPEAITAI